MDTRNGKILLPEPLNICSEWTSLTNDRIIKKDASYLISIITINYNNGCHIEKTIRSSILQSIGQPQIIVIDGGSTDNSVEIIKKYSDFIDYWGSESDTGVFDAMNKGLVKAKGNWVCFLNSGDWLADQLVIENALKKDNVKKYSILYGDQLYKGLIEKARKEEYLKYGLFACHQSMLFNKKMLGQVLWYNTAYKYFAEYELVLRIQRKGYVFLYLDYAVAGYQGGGLSSVISWHARRNKISIFLKYYGLVGLWNIAAEWFGLVKKESFYNI